MLLGNLIARLADEAVAAETMIGLCDLALAAQVAAAAAESGVTPGRFVAGCVGRFVQEAPGEEWTTVMGQMERSDNPGAALLRRMVEFGLRESAH
jgi:hypothetical protein